MALPKRILVCPLNWGLGHATRCIPIIRILLNKGAEVQIAGEGASLQLLQQEFPQLKFHTLKGISIEYPNSSRMVWKIARSIPAILAAIKKEHSDMERLIEQEKIDLVISDNRYGCYSKKVPAIFITHQLMIKTPVGEKLLHRIVLKYIARFHECWLPDFMSEKNLSGDLSHKYPLPDHTHFIGPLSRLTHTTTSTTKNSILAIVSGPEPQRSLFQQLLIDELSSLKQASTLILGKPDENDQKELGQVRIFSHLSSSLMEQEFKKADVIIARSGYSTIMDLYGSGKKALLIPTPGQTEQEYLAKYLESKAMVVRQTQERIDLKNGLQLLQKTTGFEFGQHRSADLEKRIDHWLRLS